MTEYEEESEYGESEVAGEVRVAGAFHIPSSLTDAYIEGYRGDFRYAETNAR